MERHVRIEIAEYNPKWPERFAAERARLLTAAPDAVIEHIGSTAVPGLGAKPIIDMMLGVKALADVPIAAFSALGYDYVTKYDHMFPERRYFVQPEAFHLHCVELTTEFWRRHLLFRDYLRNHPEYARACYELKLELAKEHAGDRQAYNAAKTDFIEDAVRRARS